MNVALNTITLTLSYVELILFSGINEKIAPLVPWSVAEKKLPWGVMLLLGGGFALAHISEVIIVIGLVKGLTQPVPHVRQELLTLP